MNWRRTTLGLLILVLVALAFYLGRGWSLRQEFSRLDQRQRAAILRLQQVPPPGENATAWSEVIITLHNVWGNVTFAPSYSGLSNADMQALLAKLEQWVSEATPDNSVATVERIYALLLERAKDPRFVTGYRDEFRAAFVDGVVAAAPAAE
jgi:hypothetical protein